MDTASEKPMSATPSATSCRTRLVLVSILILLSAGGLSCCVVAV
jgi:hypothetical protein